jgi:hypothetical protein
MAATPLAPKLPPTCVVGAATNAGTIESAVEPPGWGRRTATTLEGGVARLQTAQPAPGAPDALRTSRWPEGRVRAAKAGR